MRAGALRTILAGALRTILAGVLAIASATGLQSCTETSAADILTAITAMSAKLPASLGYKAASASLSIIFGAPTPTIAPTMRRRRVVLAKST